MIIDDQGWTYYTPAEIAKECHCSVSTIYDAIRSGRLEGSRSGRKWLVTESCRTDFVSEFLSA